MKKIWLVLLLTAAAALSGCGIGISDTGGTALGGAGIDVEAQTSIFNEINIDDGDPVTVDFDVYLNQTDAPFLYVEASEDVKATMRYSYTKESGGIAVHYGLVGESGESIKLESGEITEQKDGEASLELKKGIHVFWLTSEGESGCRMGIQIQAEKPERIESVSLNRGEMPGISM